MTEIQCPTCDTVVTAGLPQDATVESITEGENTEPSTDGDTKTRVMQCPDGHEVAVTFSITLPSQ